MKRAKNAAKAEAAGNVSTAESRKKQQAASAAVICGICSQTFSNTAKKPELQTHFDNKHGAKCGKTFADAFPAFASDDDDE